MYSVFLYPPVSFRFFFPFATRLSIAYVSTATFHFTLMYLASRLVKFPPLIARGESEMLEPPRTAANDVGCALELAGGSGVFRGGLRVSPPLFYLKKN